MSATVPDTNLTPRTTKGQFTYFSRAQNPELELKDPDNRTVRVPFRDTGAGRTPAERRWLAEPTLPASGVCRFRIDLGHGVFDTPPQRRYYNTNLRTLWLQDKQLFGYEPAAYVSPSRVIKIETFAGRLSTRALYVYLPRGYDEHGDKHYPVVYMHDGQNVFEAFVDDSYSGSWRADKVADRLVSSGRMQESIIIGVANGNEARILEYLPPYSGFRMPPPQAPLKKPKKAKAKVQTRGRADETAAYYAQDVAGYLREHYRVLTDRDHTATVGSSMGGLFSAYLAWETPEFARRHALMSPSFWITRDKNKGMTMLNRSLRLRPSPTLGCG